MPKFRFWRAGAGWEGNCRPAWAGLRHVHGLMATKQQTDASHDLTPRLPSQAPVLRPWACSTPNPALQTPRSHRRGVAKQLGKAAMQGNIPMQRRKAALQGEISRWPEMVLRVLPRQVSPTRSREPRWCHSSLASVLAPLGRAPGARRPPSAGPGQLPRRSPGGAGSPSFRKLCGIPRSTVQ